MAKYILFVIIQSHASFKFYSYGPYFFSVIAGPPILEPDGTFSLASLQHFFTLNKKHFKWLNDVCHCLIVLQVFMPIQSVTVAHLWIWPALFARAQMKGVDDSSRNGKKTIYTDHNLFHINMTSRDLELFVFFRGFCTQNHNWLHCKLW